MTEPELVILAAGMGSRYGGLKQIDKIDEQGHIIVDFSIYDAIRAGFRSFTFIIKHEIEKDFREVMDTHLAGKDIRVRYVFQELDDLPEGFSKPEGRVKPYGTAHAIACCYGVVDAPFAVINADDYYGAHAFEQIYHFLKNARDDEKYHYAMLGYRIGNTVTEKGTVARGVCSERDGYLTSVVERTGIATQNGRIFYIEDGEEHSLDPETVVSMNLWAFTPSLIREAKERLAVFLRENLERDPLKCEFYIPTLVSILLREGRADVRVFKNVDKWHGVTYREDKPEVIEAFRALKAAGVYPENF